MKTGSTFEKQDAQKNIAINEKFLLICMYCKKVCDEKETDKGRGKWLQLKEYVWQNSCTTLINGYCHECKNVTDHYDPLTDE
jgi:hypothetical protein